MKLKAYTKYILIILLVFFIYLSYRLIVPFVSSIVLALVLAYLFHPLYRWFNKFTGRPMLSALVVVFAILLLAGIPVVFILQAFYFQGLETIQYVSAAVTTEGFTRVQCEGSDDTVCRALRGLEAVAPGLDIKQYIISLVNKLSLVALDALKYLSTGLINFIFVLFMAFFFLFDGSRLVDYLSARLTLKKRYETKLIQTFEETTRAVVYGQLVTALVQGIIAGLGYWLIGGFSNPVILGLITSFVALIPYGGTAFVWIPASAYLMVVGLMQGEPSLITRSILLFLFGALVVSTLDNIIRVKIIGSKAHIHPVIVLLGVLGGIQLLGFVGVIVGPVIIASTIKFIDIFQEERDNL